MKTKTIRIDDIHINLLNPRYIEQESEEHEKEQIIKNGDIEKLMKDIAQFGLDPSENLLLTFDTTLNKYIVHEGNRRITALKLLKDPNLVPIFMNNRDLYISKIEDIKTSTEYKPIVNVSAVVMENFELMNHFIELKHTKNNGGAGRLDWKPEDQARFNKVKDPFKNNLLNVLTKILPDKTNDFNFTTIERIISDPDMRNALALNIEKSNGQITFNTTQGYKRFEYIVTGLANKEFNVKDFYYKNDRLNFIETYFKETKITNSEKQLDMDEQIIFPVEEIAASEATQHDIVLNSQTIENGGIDNITTLSQASFNQNIAVPVHTSNGNEDTTLPYVPVKRNRKQPEPKKRPYFFHGINYKGDLYGIKHSLYEIHHLDAQQFPFSTTMLFRTLFECVIQQFILKNNLEIKTKTPIYDLSISSLLKACTDNSSGNFKIIEKHHKQVARILNEAHALKDHDELNIVTHGNQRRPSYSKLEDIERRWYEAIKIMIEQISG
ncbi:hypothetical protein FOH38_23610 [Lysinibacillus fusiformis]|nr:hypothetical protein FOH38_23610 [Lysinibacillus fusiformis]